MLFTDKDPLTSVLSQIQDLQLEFNVVHPVAYISGKFHQKQMPMACNNQGMFWHFYVHQEVFFLSTKFRFTSTFGP